MLVVAKLAVPRRVDYDRRPAEGYLFRLSRVNPTRGQVRRDREGQVKIGDVDGCPRILPRVVGGTAHQLEAEREVGLGSQLTGLTPPDPCLRGSGTKVLRQFRGRPDPTRGRGSGPGWRNRWRLVVPSD